MSPLVLFDNHLVDANSKIKEEYLKMAHILSFGTGRRGDVDNGGEHSRVWATISWSKKKKKSGRMQWETTAVSCDR